MCVQEHGALTKLFKLFETRNRVGVTLMEHDSLHLVARTPVPPVSDESFHASI